MSSHSAVRIGGWVGLLSAIGLVVLLGALRGAEAATTPAPSFTPPIYVDQQLAGGEPEVFADTLHGRLIYTAHEGTTHLYRDGLVSSPWGDFSFVSNYCNQVNVWTSLDGGTNWYRDRYLGSQCPTSPAIFVHGNGSFGVGISVLKAGTTTFVPHEALSGTSMYAHWPAIAIDSAGTVYLVWDTDNRRAGTSGGCNGSQTPAPNSIKMVS